MPSKPATEKIEKTEKSDRAISAKEMRLQEYLVELEGKSETTQRPIIDEIVLMGPSVIKTLSKALTSGSTFQVRMASATALG